MSFEMYDVSLQGKSGLALRPEGTAAVARAFLEHGFQRAPRPVRFSYVEPMFRGQRPQLLRYRQFWQWGLECFGAEEPSADVEIVEFTSSLFAEVGFTDFDLEVNTIGDAACQPKVRDALTAYFGAHREALSETSQRRLATDVLRILDSKDEMDRKVIAGAPDLHELLCAEDRTHFEAVVGGLDRLGVR
ncbi:MAG TPA: ATP phosphoribosyltransferase regulatory subunit, partial [Gemmatimonadaceae bacterium]